VGKNIISKISPRAKTISALMKNVFAFLLLDLVLFKSGIEKFLKQTFFTSAAGNNMIVI
jgi:hypothetical protein